VRRRIGRGKREKGEDGWRMREEAECPSEVALIFVG
jgi:hypothetical protein